MLPSDSLWEGFWVVARSSFGWSELFLLQVVFLFEDGFLDPFQKAFVVVALCTSHTQLRHFASQLNV